MKPLLRLLVVALALAGCGASQRQRTLTAALASVEATQASFVTWDEAHQHEIVLSAPSLEAGEAQLAAYRDQRGQVVVLFDLAYQGIAAAALERDDVTLAEVLARVERLHAALIVLMR